MVLRMKLQFKQEIKYEDGDLCNGLFDGNGIISLDVKISFTHKCVILAHEIFLHWIVYKITGNTQKFDIISDKFDKLWRKLPF